MWVKVPTNSEKGCQVSSGGGALTTTTTYQNLTRIAGWGCPVLVESSLYHAKLARWPEPLQGAKIDSWLYAAAMGQEHSDKVTCWSEGETLVFEERSHA